jgi:20S proteasome alpha/beta subunit
MMTKEEALKMAIEALQEAKEQLGGLPQLDKLIQDCKEALENLEKDYSFSSNLQEQDIIKLAELAGFILTDDKTKIDWSSDYDDCLFKFAMLVKAMR